MLSKRKQIITFIEQGDIPVENIDAALSTTKVFPDGQGWLKFMDHLLLWMGGLAIAFSTMFFIAFNWDNLGRFAKFGMVEALLILSVLAYWKMDEFKVGAKVALLMASMFLGVLLALYGQTYQTGADPWQLFFYWALLMLPWAMVGRFPAVWTLWVALINLSIFLYFTTFGSFFGFVLVSDTDVLWALFVFDSVVLLIWERLSNRWEWLDERWAVRLIAIVSGYSITWLVIEALFTHKANGLPWLVWSGWMLCIYLAYRNFKQDLFMLAGIALSGMVVITSSMTKSLFHDMDIGGLFVLAMLVIGMGSGAAVWLRNIHREFQS